MIVAHAAPMIPNIGMNMTFNAIFDIAPIRARYVEIVV
jgi:hypothetical protein